MRTSRLALALVVAGQALAAGQVLAAAGDSDEQRAARWSEVKTSIFGDRKIEPSATAVTIEAPKRAEDASLVPMTLNVGAKDEVKTLSLVIDDNPSPYAARFTFGPAADPSQIKLRVRVNNYTNVHAVVETKDGGLFDTVQFVKASGGCSAPIGVSDEEAMKGMGEMRMKFSGEPGPGMPIEATLMVRHPQFSGLQMNQISRDYTPARFIDKLSVTQGEALVFELAGDISISSNPVIGFAIRPNGQGPIKVVATDNMGGRWEKSFTAPSPSN